MKYVCPSHYLYSIIIHSAHRVLSHSTLCLRERLLQFLFTWFRGLTPFPLLQKWIHDPGLARVLLGTWLCGSYWKRCAPLPEVGALRTIRADG